MSRTEKFDGLKGRKPGGMLMNGRAHHSYFGCGGSCCLNHRLQMKIKHQAKRAEERAVRREVMEMEETYDDPWSNFVTRNWLDNELYYLNRGGQ